MEAHGLRLMLTCGQIINGRRQISPPRPGFCPEREQMFRISYFSAYFCSKNTVFKGVFMRKKTILRDPWRPVGFRKNPWRPAGVRKCSHVGKLSGVDGKSLLRDPGSAPSVNKCFKFRIFQHIFVLKTAFLKGFS